MLMYPTVAGACLSMIKSLPSSKIKTTLMGSTRDRRGKLWRDAMFSRQRDTMNSVPTAFGSSFLREGVLCQILGNEAVVPKWLG